MPTKKLDVHTKELEMQSISGPFERISRAGAFVLNRTGDLIRVPDEALIEGRSPTIDIVSKEPWMVTKIANDPYLPLGAARARAADMDLFVNF